MTEKQNQSVLSFSLKDKNALYVSYMPFVINGGIFIPTTREYEMGQDVFMLLSLMTETERFPINGKVIWKTPPGSDGYRSAGIGVQFGVDDVAVKNKIETYLAGILESDRPTYSM
ncbi:MAG: PilZ domain-containing protein [Methylococcaceae bacterium]|jgi:type IV pilus assembly protein PilZ